MPPYPTTMSPPQSKTPCPFVDKKLQTITSNWTSHLRPYNETIPKPPLNSITLCILRNYLVSPKICFPWPIWICSSQMFVCFQKHYQCRWLNPPWKNHIHDIQNIYTSNTHGRYLIDIHTIMIPLYEHSFPIRNMFSVDIKGHGDLLVQQVL
jgi:hypothetical protein